MGDILFLAHRSPYPPDRGDKIRAYNVLAYLSERKRVHLLAFADDQRDVQTAAGLDAVTASRSVIWRGKSRAAATLEALAGGKPASLTAFDNQQMRAAVRDALREKPIDAIYVFSGQMAQYVPAATKARVIMDFCDMDSLKFADYAGGAPWPMRWLLRREARLLGRFEREVAARADATVFVSEAEAALFRKGNGAGNIAVIENGIDTDFFDPAAAFTGVDAGARLIVFTGQMDYRPNIEAVTGFARDILPTIAAACPDARFAIVGRNPTAAVRALADRDGVIVTGEVTDVRGWLAAAACVVAPLRIARGIQNKVLEAMAMARPVVASAAAAEGIDHAGTILSADDADAIAQAVAGVLGDEPGAAAMGRRARAQVMTRYGWAARLAPLDALVGCPMARAPIARNAA